MTESKRWDPFIWPTWITGLLAGEASCEFAAWFKAHFQFQKRVRDDENSLSRWQAEHAQVVRQRADELISEGWTVSVEAQNRFRLKGKLSTVSGCPDLVARRDGEVLVEDVKTGARREKDYWQVILYMNLLPLVDETLLTAKLSGAVVYRDGLREISARDAEDGRDLLYARLRATGGSVEPRRTPSAAECRFCDVATCPDRIEDAETFAAAETEAF